ncbi:cytochrome c3 family protein [Hymenobacter chitinivorans]|uniref:Mono/diheme cytochrome c family protein n=1 Tax=Hymenobacter chitinivorans DSM 11115 TaxID=1121954 RepID=A0A2M9AQK3_9BACT|nr:cytochrome c3 family protein [Hymenobacter chitinivorans]PJJ47968.1 mono/diheme cytochrome c family protein [Hymenobacter chitinivorans DSM 11115]
MNSIRLRPLSHFFLALFLTFAAVGSSTAQQGEASPVATAPAASKDGVTPGATAAAAPAAAAGATTGDAAAISAGAALFTQNCAQCHAINDVVVGPALKDVHKRRPISWLIPWVKNSSKVVASGDEYAVKLFNQYQKQQMPSFQLSDAEITSIISYVAAESDKPATAAAGGATAGNAEKVDGQEGGAAAGAGTGNSTIDILLIVLVVVLLVLVVTLVIIANIMKDVLRGRKDLDGRDVEQIESRFDLAKIYKSPVVRGLALTLFVLVVLYESVQGVMAIGLAQGYQPTQPIAFSHKLHAGENQINCSYCHTSVYKSKSANIPSANICMNCHSQIKTESPEIKKIYRAIERKQPIQWVRIHNLPDLAYFNHSQHTQVGGIECQTCHGPIQNMEVVYQYSPLTMGWCINCHRETPLNTKGNGYYTNLVKLHDKANAGAPFTVSSNGGTECSKCHY